MESKKISLIFDKGTKRALQKYLPNYDLDEKPSIDSILPKDLQRSTEIDIPDIAEVEIVRHYINLSRKNYGVDNGIYPLGSCTMKYNPKINEQVASFQEFLMTHPLQDLEDVKGNLSLMSQLISNLSLITGMDGFTLYPSAGAHGELTGLLIMKKYFEEKGIKKDKIIVPDSAHGTNPASSSIAGFSIIELRSDENGEVPLEELEFAMKGGDVAGIMLTNPNTLGLFDRNILKITEIVHKYGGLCYYDGANLNPMLGICAPGDMGFDIIHVNLHKTFSTPHGGGGPGSGPVGVKSHLLKYLPLPHIQIKEDDIIVVSDSDNSIGRIGSFWGNFLVLVKALSYILTLGDEGLKHSAEVSVLNANYLRVKLQDLYHLPYKRICQHEFVLSDKGLPNGITTEDIAKRILDYGVYAPTVYFPLIVHGAMMIEPTETESKESLDNYIRILEKIRKEIEESPEILKKAPHNTPVGRLDATLAARKPILRE